MTSRGYKSYISCRRHIRNASEMILGVRLAGLALVHFVGLAFMHFFGLAFGHHVGLAFVHHFGFAGAAFCHAFALALGLAVVLRQLNLRILGGIRIGESRCSA